MADGDLPDLGGLRIRAGCQINFYAGFPRRMCVESYEDVVARVAEVEERDPRAKIEFRVISGRDRAESEVVRISVDVQLVAQVLEVTDALEERWKEQEEEREQMMGGGAGFMIPLGGGFQLGGGGFQIG